MLNEPRSLPYISRHFFPNRRGPRLAERLLVGKPRDTLALPRLGNTFFGVFFLSLTPPDNHEWDIPEWEGLDSRYEHCCFVPESCPQSLWVFGGAQQSGNRNCIQNVQLTDSGSSWKSVSVNGKPPSPRTYHTSSACLGDRLYVFSGGEAGAAPVADPTLHVFDTASSAWSQPETQGRQPPDKHGHVIVAAGSKIYIHGGMAGDKFHNDVVSLDTSKTDHS
nr:rab9 effector protein with kelch motifs-like [Labrus bergylta]